MRSKPARHRCALALGLGLVACHEPTDGATCLPPARPLDDVVEIPLDDIAANAPPWAQTLRWYCEDPPPDELLDGWYTSALIWVDGEDCDPCDRERIASLAVTQVCDAEGPPALRLLCGPIPLSLEPWQRKGCVYAVATTSGCVY
ncbi:hypothetical protein [Nannocystis bainbridge]|uniref:Lipoprotein n=1 Tax=Nannocystis bainbridge TaxID=2995303 RepID=A0ABT5DT33_9BACT|nr:hypothetical protein [Nannocystis bainbridge]MDC0716802.1 hypothetical protein [Nannocystis bainbridge]